jgi:hypothetical protein
MLNKIFKEKKKKVKIINFLYLDKKNVKVFFQKNKKKNYIIKINLIQILISFHKFFFSFFLFLRN